MNKTIRNLAIAALFIFPGLSGFHEYEYKIDARTGAIVGTKKKLDIF